MGRGLQTTQVLCYLLRDIFLKGISVNVLSKREPPPIFSEDVEAQAVTLVKDCQKVEFPITKEQLRSSLGQVAKEKDLSPKLFKRWDTRGKVHGQLFKTKQ